MRIKLSNRSTLIEIVEEHKFPEYWLDPTARYITRTIISERLNEWIHTTVIMLELRRIVLYNNGYSEAVILKVIT